MKVWTAIAGVSLAAACAWLAGFAWFAGLTSAPGVPAPSCPAIAVLTGGAGRTHAALRLLAREPAADLLVSGVPAAITLEELAHGSGVDAGALAPRVRLGHAATNTVGNAAEIAAWMQERGARGEVGCLTVVTSSYHMPRALLELSRVLPGVELRPAAEPVEHPGWRRLAGEYSKYLIARLGLPHGLSNRSRPA